MADFIMKSESDSDAVAQELLHAFPQSKVFAFNGEMGAGKTTFIKAICRTLGVQTAMSSPTFSLVNEYVTIEGKVIYHFDLYRLNSAEEAAESGLHEYFYSGNYCFVEWPEKAPELLPDDTIRVTMKVDTGVRYLTAQ